MANVSNINGHLNRIRNSVCNKCNVGNVPAEIETIREVEAGNNRFHVETSFKYLGDTLGRCGGCSYAVSARIISSWRAFRELLPILTNRAIRLKLRGNVFNSCVRKVLLYGSEM